MLTILPKDARLWSFWGQGWLCVPVTIGWTSDSRGLVCGRLGYQLEERLPGVLTAYGRFCQSGHHDCVVYTVSKRDNTLRVRFNDIRLPTSDTSTGVVLVPTRGPNTMAPSQSWKSDVSWDQVRRSLVYLRDTVRPALHGEIYLPMLGLQRPEDQEDITESIEDELASAKSFTLLSGEDDAMIPPRETSGAPVVAVSSTSETTASQPPPPPPQLVPVVPVPPPAAPAPPPSSNENISHIAGDFEVILPRRT